MKVGLYFGSFNPIHIGHLVIANHFAEYSDLDQVWFVVTPLNPFKKKESLLDNYQRLETYPFPHNFKDKVTFIRGLPDDFYSFRKSVNLNNDILRELFVNAG